MKGRLEHDGIVLGQRLGEGENRVAIGVDPEIAPLLAFIVDAADLDRLLVNVQTVEHG